MTRRHWCFGVRLHRLCKLRMPRGRFCNRMRGRRVCARHPLGICLCELPGSGGPLGGSAGPNPCEDRNGGGPLDPGGGPADPGDQNTRVRSACLAKVRRANADSTIDRPSQVRIPRALDLDNHGSVLLEPAPSFHIPRRATDCGRRQRDLTPLLQHPWCRPARRALRHGDELCPRRRNS